MLRNLVIEIIWLMNLILDFSTTVVCQYSTMVGQYSTVVLYSQHSTISSFDLPTQNSLFEYFWCVQDSCTICIT